jgi:hypothetical protein
MVIGGLVRVASLVAFTQNVRAVSRSWNICVGSEAALKTWNWGSPVTSERNRPLTVNPSGTDVRPVQWAMPRFPILDIVIICYPVKDIYG